MMMMMMMVNETLVETNTHVSWSDWLSMSAVCVCVVSVTAVMVWLGTLAHSSVRVFERAIVRVYTSVFAQGYPACARPTALRRLSTVEVHKNVVLTKREQTLWFTQDFPTNTSGEDPEWMRAAQERDGSFISGSASYTPMGTKTLCFSFINIFN